MRPEAAAAACALAAWAGGQYAAAFSVGSVLFFRAMGCGLPAVLAYCAICFRLLAFEPGVSAAAAGLCAVLAWRLLAR